MFPAARGSARALSREDAERMYLTLGVSPATARAREMFPAARASVSLDNFLFQFVVPLWMSVSSSSLVPRALRHARPLVRHVREFDLRPTSEQVRASRDPRARLPAPETRPLPRVNTNVFSRQLCLSPLGRTKSDATAPAQRAAQGTPRRVTR